MAFPQATDYRPPIIPDGELYDNPENGKSYYWTQILLPEGSTPDTATSIGGYWTVVCEPTENKYLLRHGDTVDDCEEPAEYIWNDDVQFESTGLKGVLLPKKIKKSETDEKHITNKEYVDTQDGILADEADARSEFLCAQFFKVVNNYSEVEVADGHVIAEYNFGVTGRKYWTRPPQPGFFANGNSYYINDQGPYEIEQVSESNKWVTFFILNGPGFSVGSYAAFSKTRKLCTEIEFLQNEIIELEEEIDAIAPSVERGQFISTAYSNAPRDGEFMLATLAGKTLDYGDPAIALIQLSKVDNEGVAHTYADVEDGQLLQLFEDGNADYGLYLIEAVAGNDDPAMTAVTFTVSPVSGLGEATEGDLARLKIFSAPSGGTADGFVLKTGDEMSGKLTFKNNLEDIVLTSADVPSKLTFKNEKSDGTENTLHLWQAGVQSALVTNGEFKAKRSIHTGDYLYGWAGANSVWMPRIHMTENYVDLKYGTTTKIGVGDTYTYYYGRHNFTDSTCRIYARAAYNSTSITYGTAGQALLSNGNNAPYWGTISFSQTKANWTETTTTSSAYIQNKPTVVTGSVSGIKITSSAGNYYIQG